MITAAEYLRRADNEAYGNCVEPTAELAKSAARGVARKRLQEGARVRLGPGSLLAGETGTVVAVPTTRYRFATIRVDGRTLCPEYDELPSNLEPL